MRRQLAPLATTILLAVSHPAIAATVDIVGIDEDTNDAWRTTDVVKPFGDQDNVYGTDGYFIAQYADGDPNNVSQPAYASVATNGQYEGIGAENHQSSFDDVLATGPAPVNDLVAGDYWIEDGAAENDFFTITLNQSASFRLGVIVDQTPNLDGGPQTLWESSKGVRITGTGNLDTGIVDTLGPGDAWRDADVDYLLFDITGDAGDVFTVWGVHDDRWSANALGGLFFDPPPNPDAPEISEFTASPNPIDLPGQPVTLSWQVEPPYDSLTLDPGGINVLPNTDPAGEGDFPIDPGPDETTTYQLTATVNGESSVASVQVMLTPPEIISFEATPNIISPGETVTLDWEVALPLTSLTLNPGDMDVLTGLTNPNGTGSLGIVAGPTESTTYQLIAAKGDDTVMAEATVTVIQPGAGVSPVGVDIVTNDGWRSSDVMKPFGDDDNIYGTDGYFIAQFPDGDPQNLVNPPYATVDLVGGLRYEGLGAESHQASFDDVTQTGAGVVPDLVCGDYWLINNEPGSMNDFFTITMSQNAQFRLGVITDCTPNNPDGLLWEAATGVQIVSNTGADSGLIEVVGPNESWRNADVDYVLFDINGSVGEVYTVKGRYDGRWEANALGGVFFDPSGSDDFVITAISRDPNTGNVTVTFTSKSGVDYALQASTDMAAGTWTEVLDETGQSGTTTVVDSIVAPTAGPVFFYRVVNLDEFEE